MKIILISFLLAIILILVITFLYANNRFSEIHFIHAKDIYFGFSIMAYIAIIAFNLKQK